MKLDPYPIPYRKANLKRSNDLHVRTETIKLLEENTEENLEIGLDNDFMDMTPKAQTTKAEINTWGCIKLKSFCTVKEIINRMKRNRRKYLQTMYLIRG